MRILFSIAILISFLSGVSQTQLCGIDDIPGNKYLPDDQAYAQRIIDDSTVHTMAIRVAVIHLGEEVGEGTNISDEQIISSIDNMNLHFRGINLTTDSMPIDIGIQYCLDSIIRADGRTIPLYEDMGIGIGGNPGADIADVISLYERDIENYYYVTVVSEIGDNDGGFGIQAFAYYPNAPLNINDGTYIMHNVLGYRGDLEGWPYRNTTNESEILTHELGHALFLPHTFNNTYDCGPEDNCLLEGDRICDTPPVPILAGSCDNPACDGTQMVENYMDYTSQDCKWDFSNDQRSKMRWALNYYRANSLVDNNCVQVEPPEPPAECRWSETPPTDLTKSFAAVPFPNGVVDRVQLKFYAASEIWPVTQTIPYPPEDSVSVDIQFWPAQSTDTTTLAGRSKPGQDFFKWPVKFIRSDVDPAVTYKWRVRAECAGEYSEWSKIKYFTTPPFDPETGIYTAPKMLNGSKFQDLLRGR